MSDQTASSSDITNFSMTCKYLKVAGKCLTCHKSNVNVDNMKDFLLLGDRQDVREYHNYTINVNILLACLSPSNKMVAIVTLVGVKHKTTSYSLAHSEMHQTSKEIGSHTVKLVRKWLMANYYFHPCNWCMFV